MRILRLTEFYGEYFFDVNSRFPKLKKSDFSTQLHRYETDAFSWFGSWKDAFGRAGIEAAEYPLNSRMLWAKYCKEKKIKFKSGEEIRTGLRHVVKEFKPEIVWFDSTRTDLLLFLKSEFPEVKMWVGWVGSAIQDSSIWRHFDLVLTCAPESLEKLKSRGAKAKHLHHAFDPKKMRRLNSSDQGFRLLFVGQILKGSGFHSEREEFLAKMVEVGLPLHVRTPAKKRLLKQIFRTQIEQSIFDLFRFAQILGISKEILRKIPKVGVAAEWPNRPGEKVDPRLRPILQSAVYGQEMFSEISKSLVTLNIHADSSPKFASNMRLFEVTGAESCLLTEWRENLSELFDPETEVVAYKSYEDAFEKAQWLLRHPHEAQVIAQKGFERALKEHTFDHRVPAFLKAIGR